ncbi:retrovirus-related Pol polyprotein from transposon 412 [Trichonephila clavipes]|nr:retrovirus-related Pol polyprotein from transposon 412 [Trichonephila clavipes]
MKREIRGWVRYCEPCQGSKVQRRTKAPVRTFSLPDARFQEIHINIVSPLPPSDCNIYLLTMINRFSRWPEAVPIADMKAETISSGLWCQLDKTNNCLTILPWTKSLPGQRTVALLTQWRIVLKGGKTTTVGRRRWLDRRCMCRTPAGWKNREKEKEKREREKEGKRARKRQGLVVLESGEENPRVLLGDADQESETRMSKNALRTGRRQAVETANAPMKPDGHCITGIQGKSFDPEQMLVHGITGALLGQFFGQILKTKVYMGGDPLEMYVIVGGVSLHVINDIQANSVTDVSLITQVLH